MRGVPPIFDVVIEALVPCEDGCPHGAARITDPQSGDPDEVCLGDFEKVG